MKARVLATAALAGSSLRAPLAASAQASAEDRWTFSPMPLIDDISFGGFALGVNLRF